MILPGWFFHLLWVFLRQLFLDTYQQQLPHIFLECQGYSGDVLGTLHGRQVPNGPRGQLPEEQHRAVQLVDGLAQPIIHTQMVAVEHVLGELGVFVVVNLPFQRIYLFPQDLLRDRQVFQVVPPPDHGLGFSHVAVEEEEGHGEVGCPDLRRV